MCFMHFDWSDKRIEEWDALMARVPQSNLLQSWPYAQMVRSELNMMPRFATIIENGKTSGFFQIQEVKLAGLYHVVALDRGPLWLEGAGSPSQWQEFVDLFDRTYPRRLGRRRRLIPEWEKTPDHKQILTKHDWRPKAATYQSIWLDLRLDIKDIRSGLGQKWRNALNKALRSDLIVSEKNDLASFEHHLNQYAGDRFHKRYQGASPNILRALHKYAKERNECLLLEARFEDVPCAGVLVFLHGQAATYQMGWTDETGRAERAHQRLLWRAIELLKERDISWFDLGGIEPDAAEGVTKFKLGLGGRPYELVGMYT